MKKPHIELKTAFWLEENVDVWKERVYSIVTALNLLFIIGGVLMALFINEITGTIWFVIGLILLLPKYSYKKYMKTKHVEDTKDDNTKKEKNS